MHVKFWSVTWTKDSCDLHQGHQDINVENKKTDMAAVQIEMSLRQVQTALGSGWKSCKSHALNSTISVEIDANRWEWCLPMIRMASAKDDTLMGVV